MDGLKRRRFFSRIGITFGKLSLVAIIFSYLLLFTPIFNLIAVVILTFGILLTFGLIFLVIPNYIDFYSNLYNITEQISKIADYNLYIIIGAITLLILAFALTCCDTSWQKGHSQMKLQITLFIFAVILLVLYFVFPFFIRVVGS